MAAKRVLGTNNRGLKLIALVLGILVWLSINSYLTETKTIFVPVEVKPPKGYVATNVKPKSVTLELQGTKRALDTVTAGRIKGIHHTAKAKLDISFSEPFAARDFKLPEGVAVSGVEPDTVEFKLTKPFEHKLRVVANIKGVPAKGYEIIDAVPSPETVIVKGPEPELRAADFIYTKEIRLRGAAKTQVFKTRVAKTLRDGTPIECDDTIEVTVKIEPKRDTLSKFTAVPISVLLPPGTAKKVVLTPGTADLEITGPRKISDFEKEGMYLYIDLRRETKPFKNKQFPLQAKLAKGFTLRKLRKEVAATLSDK